MRTIKTTTMAVFALVLGLLSMLPFSIQAEDSVPRVMDTNHLLNHKTRTDLEALLSQAAKEGRADMTVFVVNQPTENPQELAKKLIDEWEVRHQGSVIQHKRGYLVLNTSAKAAVIVLSKDVRVDESLQYALREIQLKILASKLLEDDINASAFRACAAIIGALEDWPSAHRASLFSNTPLMMILQWVAYLSLLGAAVLVIRVLFFQPKWSEMSLGDEAAKLLNEEASLGMAYWRTHRHIESV